jgi:sulfur-oxidizing protein SoxY
MAQTSNVHAVVKADGRYYVATREVRVTFGGCG